MGDSPALPSSPSSDITLYEALIHTGSKILKNHKVLKISTFSSIGYPPNTSSLATTLICPLALSLV